MGIPRLSAPALSILLFRDSLWRKERGGGGEEGYGARGRLGDSVRNPPPAQVNFGFPVGTRGARSQMLLAHNAVLAQFCPMVFHFLVLPCAGYFTQCHRASTSYHAKQQEGFHEAKCW